MACYGDRGSSCSRSGSHSIWRRLLLAPPLSCQEDDPKTAKQLYQRNSLTAKKVLGPTTDFPTWGSSKAIGIPSKFDFGGQWDLITELIQDWGNIILEGINKTLSTQGPRKKEQ